MLLAPAGTWAESGPVVTPCFGPASQRPLRRRTSLLPAQQPHSLLLVPSCNSPFRHCSTGIKSVSFFLFLFFLFLFPPAGLRDAVFLFLSHCTRIMLFFIGILTTFLLKTWA